jgi:hypothetical protein
MRIIREFHHNNEPNADAHLSELVEVLAELVREGPSAPSLHPGGRLEPASAGTCFLSGAE